MQGISSSTKEAISKVVEDLFDKVALRFIGHVPKLSYKKTMLIGFEKNTNLANLFIQAMNNKYLNHVEEDVLKGVMADSYNYIDILKNKTSSEITQKLEALARESKLGKEKVSEEEINKVIKAELDKARSGLETIISAESTKTRNLGSVMDITKAAAKSGDVDPTVGFAVIRDTSTCPVCIKLNLMPDGVTPRLYKLSELSAGYYKRGDTVPSILGNHPRCRCSLFYVPSDFGFNKLGHIGFIGIGHNELEKQRAA